MLFKGDTRADLFRKHIQGRLLGISFMTLAELERWPLERNWGPSRRADLEAHLRHYTILPVNRDLCHWWAVVSFEARRRGHPIQAADAWIAATALHYDVPLITNNAADYSKVRGIVLLTA